MSIANIYPLQNLGSKLCIFCRKNIQGLLKIAKMLRDRNYHMVGKCVMNILAENWGCTFARVPVQFDKNAVNYHDVFIAVRVDFTDANEETIKQARFSVADQH